MVRSLRLEARRCIFISAVLASLAPLATAQPQLLYFPEVVLADGQPAPGLMQLVDNVDRPNLNSSGVLAGTADLDGTVADDVLIVGGAILAREDMAVPGLAGAFFGTFDEFTSRHHLNAAGDVAYVSVLTGVPTANDTALMRNLDILHREGDAAPGIAGRFFGDFTQPSMLSNGSVAFQATLTGSTLDDQVIYIDSTVQLREAGTIVGTDFDGFHWETFTHLTANGLGDLLFEATTDSVGSDTDAGLFLKPFGSAPVLLLRERVTAVPAPSGSETMEFIDFVELTDNGNWIVRGEFANSATVSTANDDCVVASIGGSPPTTLMQEGQPVPEIPGATLGVITSASIASSGDVLISAVIASPVGVNVQEGLFLNGALILHDNLPIPGLPGAILTSFEGDDVVISDSGEMILEGTLTGGPGNDAWFRVQLPLVYPVENLACSATPQNELRATWNTPAGFSFDVIQVYLDGVPLPFTLPGNATEFLTAPQATSTEIEIAVEAVIGSDASPRRQCRAAVFFQTEDLVLIAESNTNSVGAYRAFDGAYVGDLIHAGNILDTPIKAVIGPDQLLYVSDQTRDAVFRFDRNGNFVDRFLDAADGLANVRGIAFRATNLFVCNGVATPTRPPGIHAFDLQGADLGPYLESSPSSPFEPFDLHFLVNGSALATNVTPPNTVRLIPSAGGSSSSVLPANFPLQISPLSNGNFVVAQSNSSTLTEFTLGGLVTNTWPVGSPVRGVGQLGNGNLIFTTITSVQSLDRTTGQITTLRFAVSPRFVSSFPAAGGRFRRGDCNLDGSVNITDAVRLLGVLFPPGGCIPDTDGVPDGPPECPIAPCADACDANDDGSVNITDAVYLLGVLFPPAGCIPDTNGIPDGPPECPIFAEPAGACGPDPTPDNLTCGSNPACP